jgi:hypothetical protein
LAEKTIGVQVGGAGLFGEEVTQTARLQAFWEKLAALKMNKEIRKGFFSQHGGISPFAKLLETQGIYLESGRV